MFIRSGTGLDLKAFRRLDVLEIDAAEGRLKRADDIDQLADVLLVQLDVEAVDAREFLEEDGFAFHDRLGGQGADVTEAENGRAIGDDSDEILTRCQLGGLPFVSHDGFAGRSDAGRIGEREITLVAERFGRLDFEFSRLRQAMIDQRACFQILREIAHPNPRCTIPVSCVGAAAGSILANAGQRRVMSLMMARLKKFST